MTIVRSAVPLGLVAVLVAGCAGGTTGDDGPDARSRDSRADDEQVGGVDAETVTVPVSLRDRGPGLEVKPQGTLSNQRYRQGDAGSVIVDARPTGRRSGDAAVTVSGLLVLSDGTRVRCATYGPVTWSGSGDFEPFDLRCDSLVDLDLAEALVVDGG